MNSGVHDILILELLGRVYIYISRGEEREEVARLKEERVTPCLTDFSESGKISHLMTLSKKKLLSMWDLRKKKEKELDAPEQQPPDKP